MNLKAPFKENKMEIIIKITESNAPRDPDLPSHLFPGCGNGSAKFKVVSGSVYKWSLYEMIYEEFISCELQYFNEKDQTGMIVFVDEDAPILGSEFKLKPISIKEDSLLDEASNNGWDQI